MKQIKVIIPEELKEYVNSYAKKHNISFSQALRVIIEEKQKQG